MPDKVKTVKQLILDWASQGVFDALGDAVSIQDTDFKVLYQNQIHKNMVGEHIGEYCYKGYQRKDNVCENCHLAMSFADGKVHKMEQVRTTDDGMFYYEITSSPLKDVAGKIIAGTEIVRDITKRKKIENSLIKRERELAESQKVALIGSWEWDVVNNRLIWSYELYNLFGVSPQKFQPTYEALLSMVHPDDRELLDSEVKKSVRDKTPYHIDVRIINPDGREWVMKARGVINCDDSGNTVRLDGTAQDITERKQITEELRASEGRFRSLVETISDWIWEVDSNGVYTYVSPNIRDILGYAPEEVLGKTPFDLMPPDEARRVSDIFSSIIASKEPFYKLENLNVHKDGHMVTLETSGNPFFDESRQLAGYRGIDRDITQRKQVEEDLKKYRQRLEHLVKERTDELEKQKIALEQKNIALREIIGQIELEKNKMRENILGNVDELIIPILKRAKLKGIGEKQIDLIEQNLKKITSSFGVTLSSKKLKLTPREIDICNIVEKGLTNKEMSDFLNISIQSIEGYRKNIRKKLGLSNKKVNLTTYLRNLK